MNRLRRSAQFGIAAGATVLLLLSQATPSSASTASGPQSVATTGQSGNHLYSATLTVDAGPATGLNVQSVEFTVNCQATATPDAVATSITECGGAPPASIPGDFAVTAAGFSAAPGTTSDFCVAGFATYFETITGGFEVTGPRQCITVTITPLTTTTVKIGG